MKECLILANSEKGAWYQDLDFKTGFLLSKSRRYRRSPLRPEVQQIVEATGLPLTPLRLSNKANHILFLGVSQHISSDWLALVDDKVFDQETLELFIRQLQNLKIEKIKILTDSKAQSDSTTEIFARLKSSFKDIEFVSWR